MNKPIQVNTENRVVVTRGEGAEVEGKMDKGDQLYGDGWKLTFWWSAHCRVYRNRNIHMKFMQCFKPMLPQLKKIE